MRSPFLFLPPRGGGSRRGAVEPVRWKRRGRPCCRRRPHPHPNLPPSRGKACCGSSHFLLVITGRDPAIQNCACRRRLPARSRSFALRAKALRPAAHSLRATGRSAKAGRPGSPGHGPVMTDRKLRALRPAAHSLRATGRASRLLEARSGGRREVVVKSLCFQ